MSQQTQTVTARLKVEADASGATRLVNTLTGGVINLAKAEKQAAEAVKQRGAAYKQVETYRLKDEWGGRNDTYGLAKSGATFDQPAAKVPAWVQARLDMEAAAERRRQEMRQAEERQKEIRQQRADRVRDAFENPLRGTRRYYDQLAVEKETGYRDRREAEAALAARGLNADGSRLSFADRALIGTAAGRAAMTLGRYATPITAAAAVAQQAGAVSIADARTDAQPWATERQKAEQRLRNIPGGGFLLDLGRSREITGIAGEFNRKFAREEVTARYGGASEVEQFRVRGLQAAGEDQVRAFAGYRGARLDPGIDRATAAGQRQYDLAMKLLPLERERTRLATQRTGLDQTAKRAAEAELRAEEELRDIEYQRDEVRKNLRAASNGGGGRFGQFSDDAQNRFVAEGAALDKLKVLDQQYDAAAAKLKEAREQGKESAAGVRENEAARREVEIAKARVRADDSATKAAQSEAGAINLSRAGVGGRALGTAGLNLIKKLGGTTYVPKELVDAARVLDPEGVAKAEAASGEQFKAGVRKNSLDPTSPYLSDLAEARKRDAADRNRQLELEDTDTARKAADVKAGLDRLSDTLADFVRQNVAMVERYERMMMERNVGNP